MKKLLFVSLFIICAFAASAQWSIAPELGLSAFSTTTATATVGDPQ